MGWITDDGLHEGYLLPEFGDGQRGRGITGGGVPADQVVVDVAYAGQLTRYETRPASEVVGWRVMCDCRTTDDTGRLLAEDERWHSDLIARAAVPAEVDTVRGRIYAADETVTTVGDGDPLAELVRRIWWHQHIEPLEASARVEQARGRVRSATRALDQALAEARRVGVNEQLVQISWPQMMARQPHRVPGRPRTPLPQDRNLPGLLS